MMTNNSLSPFQQALVNSVLKDYDAALVDVARTGPSPKLEKWMQNEVQASQKRMNASRFAKGILIAAIITALLAFSAMAVPAVRDAIIHFFMIEYEDHYNITFDPQQAATAPEEIEVYYDISYMPSGFMFAAESKTSGSNVMLWISDSGKFIQYIQSILPNDATVDNWIGIDFEGEPQSRIIEGYDVKIIPGKESTIWVWTNNAYIFTLELPLDLSEEELTRIFASWASCGDLANNGS